MGFGGILAAIAGGFGNGMVKVANEAYKKEAEERKYQAYKDNLEREYQLKGELAEKQFAMDKEKIKLENRGRVAVAAATALKNASNSEDKNTINEAQDAFKAIDLNEAKIAILEEQLATHGKTLTAEGKEKIKAQIAQFKAHNQQIANNEELRKKIEGTGSQSLIAQHHIYTQNYRDSPASPTPNEAPTPPPVVGRVGEGSKTGEPHMIDANDPVALEKAIKAHKEQKAREQRQQAVAYGKEMTNRNSSNPYVQYTKALGY